MPHSRQQIVDEARTWLNTPWHHQGRARAGVDCAGLVVRVLGDIGYPVEDMQGYKRSPNAHQFLTFIRSQTVIQPAPKLGAIAIFRQSMYPCHVGFIGQKHGVPSIIHSHASAGKVIEEPFANEWPRLLVEIRDIKDIID